MITPLLLALIPPMVDYLKKAHMKQNIVVIPDTQIRPGDDTAFLTRIGQYIVDKQPDVVIHLGDHWDMPSLSSYDVGRKVFEGRRYSNDIKAGNAGMEALFGPLNEFNRQQRRNAKKQYKPRTIFLMGNHENRITRAVDGDAKLEGTIGLEDLHLAHFDETYDFLETVVVGGVAFSHYFTTGVAGRPASSAAAQLNKKHMSCVAGHQQGLQIHMAQRADGKRITSIIAGSCYENAHDYLGPQGNQHWNGILMLYGAEDGQFNMVPVPLDYLKEAYV